MPHRVVLYTRVGCHLCDEARELLQGELGDDHSFTEVDVDTDADLRASFGDQVPVVQVDDATVGFWRIDPVRVRAALA